MTAKVFGAEDRLVRAALDEIYGEAAQPEPSATQVSVATHVVRRVIGEFMTMKAELDGQVTKEPTP
jgi:hypothetical protein